MKSIALLLPLLILTMAISAQPDSARSIAWVKYQQNIGISLRLNNGYEYLRTDHGIGGSPFFLSDSLLEGTLLYNHIRYDKLTLQYDLSKDLVILSRPIDPKYMVPPPELIQSFDIGSHHFVRIIPDSSSPSALSSGFYELLYEGKMSVFAKRQKLPQRPASGDPRLEYKMYNDYFVRLNGQYSQVNDAGDFPDLLKDKAPELKKIIRENKRQYRKDKERQMIAAATYVDSL